MLYDLTTTLTTIASCSASIVAILGGLIASKLIALSTERNEVQTRLSETEEEVALYIEERNYLQTTLDEDDARIFIDDNIDELISGETLTEVYKDEDRPYLDIDKMQVYWDRAKIVLFQYQQAIEKDELKNEDDVPKSLAREYIEPFEYDVCKIVAEYYEKLADEFYYLRKNPSLISTPGSNWYSKTTEKLNVLNSKIDLLQLQKEQLLSRCQALQKPKGMKLGLLLFLLFSAFNIVLPLYRIPFSTEDFNEFSLMKIQSIVFFAIGLALIILYLIYLLCWSKKEKWLNK